MPFFMFSLRVGQLLEEDLMPPPQRKKRLFLLAATLRRINDHNHRTTYNYHTASPKICYQYRWTDECIGLCGIKCRCAKWVCGDCCFHGGCAAQDYCCKRIGYFRCMFGYHTNFSCDGVAACSGLTCCQWDCISLKYFIYVHVICVHGMLILKLLQYIYLHTVK